MTFQQWDIIEIYWTDSQETEGWTSYEDFKLKPLPVHRSIGYFIQEDEKQIAFTHGIDERLLFKSTGTMDGVYQIPKLAIEEIKIIRSSLKTRDE